MSASRAEPRCARRTDLLPVGVSDAALAKLPQKKRVEGGQFRPFRCEAVRFSSLHKEESLNHAGIGGSLGIELFVRLFRVWYPTAPLLRCKPSPQCR